MCEANMPVQMLTQYCGDKLCPNTRFCNFLSQKCIVNTLFIKENDPFPRTAICENSV